ASSPSIRQESTERPSTSTAHVPHSPSSQPCFVPVRLRSSRRTSSSVLCGAKATSTCSPLSVNPICFLLWSGTVVLLDLIQNHVVDQSRLPDVGSDGDERRLFVDPVDLLETLGVGDRDVVESRARFRFNCRPNQLGQTSGTPLAFFEGCLRFLERAMNYRSRALFVRRQIQITRRDRQSRILTHDRQHDDLRIKGEIPDETANHERLLRVFLSEEREV